MKTITPAPHGNDWLQYLRDNLPRDRHGNYGTLDDLKIRISDRVAEDAQRSIGKLLPVSYNEFFPPVIISYATGYRKATNDYPGKLLAAGIITALFEEGCPCYSDLLTPSGRNWSDYMMRIYSKRANAQIMIVLMTQAFFRSVWCLEEVNYALEHDCIILPVRVEEKAESGKEISRDLASMWPDKVLDEWAEKNDLNDCGPKGRIKISELNRSWSVVTHKLMNTASIPVHGSLLNDEEFVAQLVSDVKEILGSTENDCEEKSQLKNIDVYFAMQVPSTVVDNLSHRPKHLSALKGIKESIEHGNLEELKQLDSVYLTDARRKDVEADFESSRVRLFVWCAEGVDESDNSDEELSIAFLRNIFQGQKRPEVVVVCMAYGAELAAKALQGFGAGKVIWIRMDPYSQNLLSQRVKKILSFCADILLGRDSIKKIVENFQNMAGRLDPRCACGYYADATPLSPRNIANGEQNSPRVTTNIGACCCSTDWFESTDLAELKLDYADIPRLEIMKRAVLEHGRLKQLRQYFLMPHSRARERKETWNRARAFALYMCNEIARDGAIEFDYVCRIASEADALELQKKLKGTSDRALVWVDFAGGKEDPFDSPDAAKEWISEFGRRPTLVLLFTSVALRHDQVQSIVSGLGAIIEGDPAETLSAPEGPEIAVGQFNVFLSVLPHEETKQSILDKINGTYLLREAVMRCVSGGDDIVIDPRFNQIKVYRDDESYTQIRICIADLADLKRLLDVVFLGEGAKRIAAALSQPVDVVKFDYSAFATYYEKVMMQLDTLTDHQREKMAECKDLGMIHIEGGAGTGKTFIALNNIIDYLRRYGVETNCVLYVCHNTSLAFHFAKWLCYHVSREEVPEFLSRIHFLTHDYPTGFILDFRINLLRQSPLPSKQLVTYVRIVVDEAHDVFQHHEGRTGNTFREKVVSMVQSHQKRVTSLSEDSKLYRNDRFQIMLLSDLSQASAPKSDIAYPSFGLPMVKLTEVCRSSKRVIAGAMSFQLTAKSQTSFAHESDGLPLRVNLFPPAIGETSRFSTYAKKVVETINEIFASYHHLDLHDRLAIVVPDEAFREGLCEGEDGLVELLNRHKDDLGQHLVPVRALQASKAVNLGTLSHDKRWIIVDTVAEMDGLERLAVLGVGLDEAIGGDKHKLKLVCSRIYRAFTRAHLIFCLVNERIAGGWFNFIDLMEEKPGDFFFEKVVEHSNDAATKIMAPTDKPATASLMPLSEAESTIDIAEVVPSENLANNASPRRPQCPLERTEVEDLAGDNNSFRRKKGKLPNLGIFITNNAEEEDVTFTENVDSSSCFIPLETAETVKALSHIDSGGIDDILSTMKDRSFHAGVQGAGCGAVARLAFNDDNIVLIANSGGIDVVLSAMQHHPSNADVQKLGCAALWRLAVNDDNRVSIAEQGGIDVILSTMQQHPLHAGVQLFGCGALSHLAFKNNANRVSIAEQGGIETILSAMQQHPSDVIVQERGCGALYRLSFYSIDQLVSKGAIETVELAQRNHPNDNSVKYNSNMLLNRLRSKESKGRFQNWFG